ncbi:MAG: glycosyltransferase [Caldisphaera sp.]
MSRKSCAIIVVYNKVPKLNQINVALLQKELDYLIIVDNSNKAEFIEGIKSQYIAKNTGRYFLIQNHENLGISKALNKGINLALEKGVYFMFLLDDDAVLSQSFFKREINVFEDLLERGEMVGAVCPVVSNDINQLGKKIKKYDLSQIRQAITSGLLLSKETIQIVGLYPEEFFLEWADIAYTRRILNKGLKIFRINEVLIFQDFGESVREKRISLFPYFILSIIENRVIFNLGYGNDFFRYAPIYSPEREIQIIKERIRLGYLSQGGKIHRLLFMLKFTLNIFLRETTLFIGTKNADYIKAFKILKYFKGR